VQKFKTTHVCDIFIKINGVAGGDMAFSLQPPKSLGCIPAVARIETLQQDNYEL
jgi:hypothetical protein